jgi:hypothetical protein
MNDFNYCPADFLYAQVQDLSYHKLEYMLIQCFRPYSVYR